MKLGDFLRELFWSACFWTGIIAGAVLMLTLVLFILDRGIHQ